MTHIPYIIQVQICIGLFWLMYRFFMHNSGAFAHNRIYLLGAVIASFAIPAMSIPVWTPQIPVYTQAVMGDLVILSPLPEEAVETGTIIPWETIMLWICIGGMLYMLSGVIYHFCRMIRSVKRSRILKLERARIVHGENIRSPYSFFNYIFVNKSADNEKELPQIIAHEMAHIKLRHSYDSLFAQIVLILFWWNPFIWLWKRSLKEVHEYQADRTVLKQGVDSKQYITLLVETLTDIHPEFVSGFSYSLIKNRLVMMTKKSSRLSKFRILTAAPALTVTLLLFSFTDKPIEMDNSTVKKGNIELNENALAAVSPKEVNTASSTPGQEQTLQSPPPTEEEPFIIVEIMPTFQGGDATSFRQWIMSQLRYPQEAAKNNVQGRVTTTFIIEKDGSLSNVQVVESADALLSEEAVRILNSSPKWTPGTQRGKAVRVKFIMPIDFNLGNPSSETDLIRKDGKATIFINGKLFDGELSHLKGIESISIVNDRINYPNGRVDIILKEESPGSNETVQLIHSVNDTTTPLYVIDDKIADEETFNKLDPETIESITILKDEAATQLYKDAGKNRVIVVTKKP